MINLHSIEELLITQNPHWGNSKELVVTGVKRDCFDGFCKELVKKKLIITLNGPRRSGKTFILKQSMEWLVKEKGVPSRNILYFQFSMSLNEKEIILAIIDLFLKKISGEGRKYIFFDEVQCIDYWQDQVKMIYDLSSEVKFAVSGSTFLFYRQKSKESLAGRLLKLKLGALNFGEYLRFKGIEEPSADRVKFITNLSIYKTEFRKYLATGQYPEIVANTELDPKKYIMDLSDQIINFDIPYFSVKIDRSLFLSLVKTLSFDLAEEYSASNLAKVLETDREKITEYIKILDEMGLFSTCYNSSFKSMRKKLVGTKKIYGLNLNLALHINGFDESYFNDSRVYGRYFENYVFMRLQEKNGKIEYYRANNNELDFVSDKDAFKIKSGKEVDAEKYNQLSLKIKKKFYLITEEEGYLI